MLTTNMPVAVATVPIKLVQAGLLITLCVTSGNLSTEWFSLLFSVLGVLIFEHFGNIAQGLLVVFFERRRMKHLRWYQYAWYLLLFPIFTMIGDLMTLVALFTKVTWKPIPHNSDIRIEELEGEKLPEERELVGSQSKKT
jgi:hypothetical protein